MKHIASVQNTYIKSLIQLQEKSKVRKQTGLFLIEGKREIELAIKGGYQINTILFCDVIDKNIDFEVFNNVESISVSKEVYEKLAYRESTEGIIGVAVAKKHELKLLELRKNPLLLIAEAPEKPGNIGALLRTADAANIDAVILADLKGDIYNSNVVRSSVGCLFTVPIALGTSAEIIEFLKVNQINLFSATLQDATPYHLQDFTQATALAVGTEATGLSSIWREFSKQNIIIPMQGTIDSMNVSVAAAVLLFEAKRQRNFI